MIIKLQDFPQLQLLAWNLACDAIVDEAEALSLYERNWRFVDVSSREVRAAMHGIRTFVESTDYFKGAEIAFNKWSC